MTEVDLSLHCWNLPTMEGLFWLNQLPKLTSLTLNNLDLSWNKPVAYAGRVPTCEGVKVLASLRLTSLTLHSVEDFGGELGHGSGYGLDPICRITTLTFLDLSFNDANVINDDFHELRRLINLRTLRLDGLRESFHGDFDALLPLRELREISMQDTMLEDTGASTNALARVTQLTTLTFGTELTDAHLQALSALTQLESFTFAASRELTDVGVFALRKLRKLRTLESFLEVSMYTPPPIGEPSARGSFHDTAPIGVSKAAVLALHKSLPSLHRWRCPPWQREVDALPLVSLEALALQADAAQLDRQTAAWREMETRFTRCTDVSRRAAVLAALGEALPEADEAEAAEVSPDKEKRGKNKRACP